MKQAGWISPRRGRGKRAGKTPPSRVTISPIRAEEKALFTVISSRLFYKPQTRGGKSSAMMVVDPTTIISPICAEGKGLADALFLEVENKSHTRGGESVTPCFWLLPHKSHTHGRGNSDAGIEAGFTISPRRGGGTGGKKPSRNLISPTRGGGLNGTGGLGTPVSGRTGTS